MNLLNNAAKYTPDGGQIWLSVERRSTDVVIHVPTPDVALRARISIASSIYSLSRTNVPPI